MSESPATTIIGAADDPQSEYRSIEMLAIAALVLGLLSPLAMVAALLALVPILGILISLLALRRLNSEEPRAGRPAALMGLGLSVLFLALPIAERLSTYAIIAHQARPIADQFLLYLREESPEKAQMLRFAPTYRRPLDEGIWLFYRHDLEAKQELLKLLGNPAARTILELGDRAEIRYQRVAALGTDGTTAQVSFWYSVTYVDDAGKKKTFMVNVLAERKPTSKPGLGPWRVKDMNGFFNPNYSG